MAFKMAVGILKDKEGKKVYRPGDTIADSYCKKHEKTIESGLKAGSIVETMKRAKLEPGDK